MSMSPYVHYFDPSSNAPLNITADGTTTFTRPEHFGKSWLRISVPTTAVFDGGALTINRLSRGGRRNKLAEWTAPDQKLVEHDGGWWKIELVFAGSAGAAAVPVEVDGWNEGDILNINTSI